jgi:hypothetical protein
MSKKMQADKKWNNGGYVQIYLPVFAGVVTRIPAWTDRPCPYDKLILILKKSCFKTDHNIY